MGKGKNKNPSLSDPATSLALHFNFYVNLFEG